MRRTSSLAAGLGLGLVVLIGLGLLLGGGGAGGSAAAAAPTRVPTPAPEDYRSLGEMRLPWSTGEKLKLTDDWRGHWSRPEGTPGAPGLAWDFMPKVTLTPGDGHGEPDRRRGDDWPCYAGRWGTARYLGLCAGPVRGAHL